MSDDSFENVLAEVGGLSEGAARVRVWAVDADQGEGVLIATADLLVDSARTLDDARERGSTYMRSLSTLYRQHRENLAQLTKQVPVEEPVDEFNALLEDLRS